MARARSKPRSRTSFGAPGEGWHWVAGLFVCALTIAAVGGYAYLQWWVVPTRVVLDPERFCPDKGPRSVAVVLLDATDELPDITKREVHSKLKDVEDAVAPYGLLEMRLLDPGTEGGRIMFSMCKPAEADEWTENKARREQMKEKFRQALNSALNGTLQPAPADSSPIMGTIQHIAVERFGGRARKDLPKSLIIISDMVEHTQDYSQYKGDLSYERFSKSPAYKKLRTDLHGARVYLNYVQRLNPPIHTGKHQKFWLKWLHDNNGEWVGSDKLPGAN